MPLLHIVILALVQGFTEFLPISSTAHLYLTSWLVGWTPQSLEFDIMLHLGTLLAILVYFLRDWVQIIAQGFGLSAGTDPELKRNRSLLWLMAVGTIPVGVAGFLLNDLAETVWRTPFVMGSALIVVGILMWIADDRLQKRHGMAGATAWDAIVVGLSQALALIPGCSRSGITITAARFRGFDRETAARFSFLLSTPAIGGAAAKALWDIHKHGSLAGLATTEFAVGVAVSAISGLAVIAWFLHYLRDKGLRLFVYYRIVFGIIVLALAFIRRPA
jgi:undecaprenyl-diphosphatase